MTEDYQGLTPPPELVEEWLRERPPGELAHTFLATQAARWGADQELEACCEWVDTEFPCYAKCDGPASFRLANARRPKPPSLAEEALEAMRSMQIEPYRINGITVNAELISKYALICRALERLQELEGGNG